MKWRNSVLDLFLLVIAAGQAMIFLSFRRQNRLDSHVPEFIALVLLAGVLYIAGVYVVERFALDRLALFIIIVAAVSYRAVLLPAKPALSVDVYRYQWEGRVQRASINPYTVYPANQGFTKPAWIKLSFRQAKNPIRRLGRFCDTLHSRSAIAH